ncbi:hypothetical protein CHF27_009115 [Romboutsia maritimum]|uniref:Uncharacterized protein n=1 Tax=Romboutsia maritimum TaxID=2020948 RepID=A0A371IS37_9FIRM|nr:hypothetical protein [Romboutsia maritimum]RDY23291.1 hypothetical protein CHF27_009115 [Romboutsia maritimum]
MRKNTIVLKYKNEHSSTFKKSEIMNFEELKDWVESILNGKHTIENMIIKFAGRPKMVLVDRSEIRQIEILETRQIDVLV